jgi:hypothetical protein
MAAISELIRAQTWITVLGRNAQELKPFAAILQMDSLYGRDANMSGGDIATNIWRCALIFEAYDKR